MTERQRRRRPPPPTEADLNEPISLWPLEGEEVLRKILQDGEKASPEEEEKES